jgi:steroid 5-alpha reductase family enzyme|mmetsp:Transcript_6093/g.7485  ORF Transcript_6093/g.7485 Transcript_6093/m.7485 type:complete len:315 (-) Transcript_6093:87-1031(-)|eukprot:CAMPEP_0195292000 /NCGR_PEP_ID=MMETSP0707-20130614/8554_1 /TAXON_ID=33640 /ORGANISM="Asterionellopsis glacialis, Strain CCMP134" /LENGTH=314 /DNA_ID=CAMNT_0040352371 /DNA_START=98 /DNA_END=1042 /DNA_ORIENTATION=+
MSTADQGIIYAISIGITLVIQLSGFAVAFAYQTEKFYDVLGGINYLILAAYSAAHRIDSGDDDNNDFWNNPRKVIMTVLFCVSRAWLLLFLAWRAHERKGDSRFDEVKSKFGLFLVYWIGQAFWVLLISMPMIFVNSSSSSTTNFGDTVLDWIGTVGFGFSILIEIAGDIQKSVWVKAGRQGGFCTVGVWKYSRHPNYFGEIFQWWCAWLLAYGSASNGIGNGLWWSCILSPLFTMNILLNTAGTGVWNAEGQSLKRYYDRYGETYQEYRTKTSILIPMVGYQYIPLWIKRVFLFEWTRFEYKPEMSEQATDHV